MKSQRQPRKTNHANKSTAQRQPKHGSNTYTASSNSNAKSKFDYAAAPSRNDRSSAQQSAGAPGKQAHSSARHTAANKGARSAFEYSTKPVPASASKHKADNKRQDKPATAPIKSKSYEVKQQGELLAFLLEQMSGSGRNAVKAMLARGQIAVNGRVTKAYNYNLEPGQTVIVRIGRAPEEVPMIGLRIIHEDDDVLIIHKDAGLLSISSHNDFPGDEVTAYRQLMAHVRKSGSNNRVFVVHRLDRDTSGVMMFAKSEHVQQTLQQSWQDTVQERTYIALVEGAVKKPEGTVKSWLKETKTLKMYSSPFANDGQLAITHYKSLQTNRHYSLLEVNLETGRKNQIRVHMHDIGHPIVGDKKYGAKSKTIGRLGLHARVLAFKHPTSGKLMRFETDIPKTFTNLFREER
nr:RluA family pseudouridine synthase [Paenibacillus sp. ACRRX]